MGFNLFKLATVLTGNSLRLAKTSARFPGMARNWDGTPWWANWPLNGRHLPCTAIGWDISSKKAMDGMGWLSQERAEPIVPPIWPLQNVQGETVVVARHQTTPVATSNNYSWSNKEWNGMGTSTASAIGGWGNDMEGNKWLGLLENFAFSGNFCNPLETWSGFITEAWCK